jgi:hypothetical protein
MQRIIAVLSRRQKLYIAEEVTLLGSANPFVETWEPASPHDLSGKQAKFGDQFYRAIRNRPNARRQWLDRLHRLVLARAGMSGTS